MTTPEEGAPKTHETDQALRRQAERAERTAPDRRKPAAETEMGTQLKQAMEEAGMDREDFTGP
ncbi:hypothetical protein [Thermostaphylospora chromogena]|uniref:Uncharacterized protein n=1 Tax=Thermostaphylospora chromogena TaxID=35622 RepID=A0A1H1CBD8_9ACTN|nr:hypothetical protein [Thermostaphylospora chromogena]SDQ61389.1 hypothetical protein SAMN04489764_1388 [Thermostaphylospora chromogena]